MGVDATFFTYGVRFNRPEFVVLYLLLEYFGIEDLAFYTFKSWVLCFFFSSHFCIEFAKNKNNLRNVYSKFD